MKTHGKLRYHECGQQWVLIWRPSAYLHKFTKDTQENKNGAQQEGLVGHRGWDRNGSEAFHYKYFTFYFSNMKLFVF